MRAKCEKPPLVGICFEVKIRIRVVRWDKENDLKKTFKLQLYSVSSRKLVCYSSVWTGSWSGTERLCVHSMHGRMAQFIALLPWWHCIAPHCILIISSISVCYSTIYLAVVLRYCATHLFAGDVDKSKGHSWLDSGRHHTFVLLRTCTCRWRFMLDFPFEKFVIV